MIVNRIENIFGDNGTIELLLTDVSCIHFLKMLRQNFCCLAVAGGIPSIALMENAGRAVADAAVRILQGRRVVIVAGPGNNGGDGFVAARYLAERGLVVSVCFLGKRERLTGDAALAAQRWNGPVSEPSPATFADCDLIVDALFGAGLDRDVEGPARIVIDLMNGASAPI